MIINVWKLKNFVFLNLMKRIVFDSKPLQNNRKAWKRSVRYCGKSVGHTNQHSLCYENNKKELNYSDIRLKII